MTYNKKTSSIKHHGPIIDTIDGRNVIDCKECKYKHVYPIPTDQEIEDFYSKTFYSSEKPDYFKDAEEDMEWWGKTYENYFQLLEKYSKGKKLLDIGSGPGYFLKCAQEQGWEVLGIEPSKDACEYSRKLGVNVINDYFDLKRSKNLGKFDVISLNLVLEHLPDPVNFLNDLRSMLHKDGLIFIFSPNDYNPFQKVARKTFNLKPWWVFPLEHINYFDFVSIKKLLKSLNFTIVDSLATYPMELFLLSGDNYVDNRDIGRECHKKRKTMEMNLYQNDTDSLNSFYRNIAKNNIGRHLVIIGKKND